MNLTPEARLILLGAAGTALGLLFVLLVMSATP